MNAAAFASEPETPAFRAALLAEAIQHSVHLEGPITVTALMKHLVDWAEVGERECGGDIYAVIFLLMRSGFYVTNSHVPAENTYTIGADTVIVPSRMVTTYIHAGMVAADEDD